METKPDLQALLHEAMKAHDELKKRVLRMLMAAVKLNELNKGDSLDAQEFLAAVQKEIKTRNETLEDARKAGRPQMIADAEAEIEFLQTFLPQQLSEEELEALVNAAIAESGAASVKQMGLVMKLLVPKLEGRATSQRASQAVKTQLERLG